MQAETSPIKNAMSFGCGVQSTTMLILAAQGIIPKPDHLVFSNPGFESEATYVHLERCKEYATKHGMTIDVVSAGNIEYDAIQFAPRTVNKGIKRYASLPLFLKNNDGTPGGLLPRQCTSEFKIEPIEKYHRRTVLGLAKGKNAPKIHAIDVWIGFSTDEQRRVSGPGRWKTVIDIVGADLFGTPIEVTSKQWEPIKWQAKVFPLLGTRIDPVGEPVEVEDERFCAVAGWSREDCRAFLLKNWPTPVPRSACLCCPYRRDGEWEELKEHAPKDFRRAVAFDHAIRESYRKGQGKRGKPLASIPYVHKARIPLGQVDFAKQPEPARRSNGIFENEFECSDGICGT